jgi:MoaA/NifB/PqqE/SkfB family radical SAM enzyme
MTAKNDLSANNCKVQRKRKIGIEIKITDKCNQSCFHCMNDDSRLLSRELDRSLFASRLVEWWNNRKSSPWQIKEVRMTGGEPLMNLPAVMDIAKTCSSLGICSGINTNALLFNEAMALALKKVGLTVIKVSYDAVDQATLSLMRGPNASLARTEAGISIAVAHGFRVILRLTISAYNVHQLVDCYHAARDMGVEKLQVKPLIRSGRSLKSDAFLGREQIRAAFRALAKAAEGSAARPDISCCPPEDAFGLNRKICGSLDKIYFLTNGEAIICNYIPNTAPIGNLSMEPLDILLAKRNPRLFRSPRGHTILNGCPETFSFINEDTLSVFDQRPPVA